MASSVALVNKDISRHYQLANLLAPPEAIELTKLYNEMSDILAKPVKFRNTPTQLHLFYDLLSQYAKHFENVKLDNAPIKPPPKPDDKTFPQNTPQKQPSSSPPSSPPLPDLSMDDDANISNISSDASDQTVISASQQPSAASTPKQSSALVPFRPSQQTPISTIPQNIKAVTVTNATPKTEILKMLGLSKIANVETPRKVLSILEKHDSTFKFYPDAKTITIQGHNISSNEFLRLLDQLRNPNFKQNPSHPTSDILVYTIAQHVQNESEAAKKKLFKQLPGLEKFIIAQPSGTRATSRRKLIPADESAVSSGQETRPRKIGTKEGHGRAKKSSTIVHWSRWQKHLKKYTFFPLPFSFSVLTKHCEFNFSRLSFPARIRKKKRL